MPARPFALLHGAPRPGLGHVAGPDRRLLVEAVEEEGDVVLEAGDGGGGRGAGAEAGVGRGGVEAVGVGDAGAGHGPAGSPSVVEISRRPSRRRRLEAGGRRLGFAAGSPASAYSPPGGGNGSGGQRRGDGSGEGSPEIWR